MRVNIDLGYQPAGEPELDGERKIKKSADSWLRLLRALFPTPANGWIMASADHKDGGVSHTVILRYESTDAAALSWANDAYMSVPDTWPRKVIGNWNPEDEMAARR